MDEAKLGAGDEAILGRFLKASGDMLECGFRQAEREDIDKCKAVRDMVNAGMGVQIVATLIDGELQVRGLVVNAEHRPLLQIFETRATRKDDAAGS